MLNQQYNYYKIDSKKRRNEHSPIRRKDEERLEYLFKLYEKMIQEEKDRATLFQNEKKDKKKRK